MVSRRDGMVDDRGATDPPGENRRAGHLIEDEGFVAAWLVNDGAWADDRVGQPTASQLLLASPLDSHDVVKHLTVHV